MIAKMIESDPRRHHIHFPKTTSAAFDWALEIALEIDAIAELMIGYRGEGMSAQSVQALGYRLAEHSDAIEERLKELIPQKVFAEYLDSRGERKGAHS